MRQAMQGMKVDAEARAQTPRGLASTQLRSQMRVMLEQEQQRYQQRHDAFHDSQPTSPLGSSRYATPMTVTSDGSSIDNSARYDDNRMLKSGLNGSPVLGQIVQTKMGPFQLPPNWVEQISKSQPTTIGDAGRPGVYFANTITKETTWKFPIVDTPTAHASTTGSRGSVPYAPLNRTSPQGYGRLMSEIDKQVAMQHQEVFDTFRVECKPYGINFSRTGRVDSINRGSPADKAGVIPPCQICKISGTNVDSSDWMKIWRSTPCPYTMTLRRTAHSRPVGVHDDEKGAHHLRARSVAESYWRCAHCGVQNNPVIYKDCHKCQNTRPLHIPLTRFDVYMQRCQSVYQKVNPSKIPMVKEFLETDKGSEHELYCRICDKYGETQLPKIEVVVGLCRDLVKKTVRNALSLTNSKLHDCVL